MTVSQLGLRDALIWVERLACPLNLARRLYPSYSLGFGGAGRGV